MGAAYFITYTGFAYQYGFGVFAMMAGILGGTLLFGYWAAPKVAALSKAEKFYTLGHFVSNRYQNKKAGLIANSLGMAILFCWLVVGVIGSGKIIDDLGLLPYNVALLATSFILCYLLLAGFRAVIITDVIQSFVILALLGFITYNIIGKQTVVAVGAFSGGTIDLATAAGFFVYGTLAAFSYPDAYQLVYSGKSKKGVRHGIGLSVLPVILVGCLLALIGMFMSHAQPGLSTGLVFTESLKHFLNPAFVPLAIILFFAGVISSSDTSVFSISSHFASHKKGDFVKNTRWSIVALLLVVTAIAILLPNVVKVSLIAAGLSLTLSWAMIYTIAGGRDFQRFVASIIGAFLGFAFGVSAYGLEPEAALPTVIFGLLGLLWPRKIRVRKLLTRLYSRLPIGKPAS